MVSKSTPIFKERHIPSIDFKIIKTHFKEVFTKYAEEAEGDIILVLDKDILPIMEIIIGDMPKLFCDKYYLETEPPEREAPNIFYLAQPKMENLQLISGHIKKNQVHNRSFTAIFCPRITSMTKMAIDNDMHLKSLRVEDLNVDLIPIEPDVLTMEDDESFRNLILGYDTHVCSRVIQSIQRLETLFGAIPYKWGKGTWSTFILDRAELEHTPPDNIDTQIDALILIDRTVDLITPLCSQRTYEGVLHEAFGIKLGKTTIPANFTGRSVDAPSAKVLDLMEIPLNSTDLLYAEIRDLNIEVCGENFQSKGKAMENLLTKNKDQHTLEQVAEYTEELKNLHLPTLKKSFDLHLNIATSTATKILKKPKFKEYLSLQQGIMVGDLEPNLMERFELEIANGDERIKIYRLLCLLSLTCNGIKPKQYELLARELVQAFGIKEIICLINMEKAGLLKRNEKKSNNWESIRKQFKLILWDINLHTTRDIAYTFDGYAPLSIRLVERLLESGWSTPDINKYIPQPKKVPQHEKVATGTLKERPSGRTTRVVIVYFIGGITFAEISALRLLNTIYPTMEFIAATTQMINGINIIEDMMEDTQNMLKIY